MNKHNKGDLVIIQTIMGQPSKMQGLCFSVNESKAGGFYTSPWSVQTTDGMWKRSYYP